MKLKTRILVSFLIIILLPIVLGAGLLIAAQRFQARELMNRYGVDLTHISPDMQSFMAVLLLWMVIILIITAIVLSLWIYSAITGPIVKLSKATKNIRDGNLDFTIKSEGVAEVKELCEDFEDMRQRLKTASEESARFEADNRELISNISHDLKTPITAVKGYVEGIMDGVADTPEKMDKYIRTIYNKANEMDHLINELTFYSKIDTNRIPYAFNKVPVDAFFSDAAEEIQLEMDQKGVRFTYQCEVAPGTEVIADVEQIRRVINNIISNSLKYMDKPDKKIALRVVETGDDVVAAIEDNGKGIAQKDIEHIFDRFYRTDSSRSSAKGGSGIGLSIVRKIVEDHGGHVWATSREGEGTTMFFALRIYREPGTEIERPADKKAEKSEKKAEKRAEKTEKKAEKRAGKKARRKTDQKAEDAELTDRFESTEENANE